MHTHVFGGHNCDCLQRSRRAQLRYEVKWCSILLWTPSPYLLNPPFPLARESGPLPASSLASYGLLRPVAVPPTRSVPGPRHAVQRAPTQWPAR